MDNVVLMLRLVEPDGTILPDMPCQPGDDVQVVKCDDEYAKNHRTLRWVRSDGPPICMAIVHRDHLDKWLSWRGRLVPRES